ncbi:MAG: hypothetical protein JO307_33005 [Bryobacterales bacterium]|nr:hypothetical protein [Bryobacterales bacterium]MBV9400578.1 hypothetical protein [Bryobacterales bacterium]
MQFQPELPHPLLQIRQEPLGFFPVLNLSTASSAYPAAMTLPCATFFRHAWVIADYLCQANTATRSVSKHPYRTEGGLGIRVENADRGSSWYSGSVQARGGVFGGLLTVILVGLPIDNLVFRAIENRTVRKWGMQV